MMRSGVPVVNGGDGPVLELFPPLDVFAIGVGLAGGDGDRFAPGRLVDEDEKPSFFDQEQLDALRSRQVDAARAVDGVLENLFDSVPAGTWVVVTSDHGELFGEGGYFGHGPIAHEKVFEVPFVEGRVR